MHFTLHAVHEDFVVATGNQVALLSKKAGKCPTLSKQMWDRFGCIAKVPFFIVMANRSG